MTIPASAQPVQASTIEPEDCELEAAGELPVCVPLAAVEEEAYLEHRRRYLQAESNGQDR